jgi:hypothetical protein
MFNFVLFAYLMGMPESAQALLKINSTFMKRVEFQNPFPALFNVNLFSFRPHLRWPTGFLAA